MCSNAHIHFIKYAHGHAVSCCVLIGVIKSVSLWVIKTCDLFVHIVVAVSGALGQSYVCSRTSKVNLGDMENSVVPTPIRTTHTQNKHKNNTITKRQMSVSFFRSTFRVEKLAHCHIICCHETCQCYVMTRHDIHTVLIKCNLDAFQKSVS